jgi:hypothetical protein
LGVKVAGESLPAPDQVAGGAAAAAAGKAAAAGTKAAGRAVAAGAKRAQKPLAVGGGAAAGVLGGLALRRRANGSRNGARHGFKLPVAGGRIDPDAVASAGKQVETFGRQLNIVATALRAQHKK